MQIIPRRLFLTAAFAAAALSLGAPAGHAATYGDQKWCAVSTEGGANMMWDCEYDSPTDCEPAITAGNRGFCAINPYYQPPQPSPAPVPQR